MANEITIVRGDTPTIKITVTDSDGAVFDLTNYTARLTVKEDALSKDADAAIGPVTGTISTPTNGIITFPLSVTNTDQSPGIYSYDVQINNGTTDVQTVVGPAEFSIKQGITRDNS